MDEQNSNIMQNNVHQQQMVSQQPKEKKGGLGISLTSMILGILGLLTSFTWILTIFCSPASFILGIISLCKHYEGKGMAITGIVLSTITFAFVFWLLM